MKLLFCNKCHDVICIAHTGECYCGETKGYYIDNLNARYKGDCIPLGFENTSFGKAVRNQPENGRGVKFAAFVIPKECDTFIKIEEEVNDE